MNQELIAFIEKMEKQRFLPITENTFQLYQDYSNRIDPHNPDALSYLLFYEGEYYFRTGNIMHALSNLTRCLKAPKSSHLQFLDALSYNLLGLIYCYLGQETTSIIFLLQAKTIHESLKRNRDCAICDLNLGYIYTQLECFDLALDCYLSVLAASEQDESERYSTAILGHTYRGILYCKHGDYANALLDADAIERLYKNSNSHFYDAAICNFHIHLYDFHREKDRLNSCINELCHIYDTRTDFPEMSIYYLDSCSYLLSKELYEEAFLLLSHIEEQCMGSPFITLRCSYLEYLIAYYKHIEDNTSYLATCGKLISLTQRHVEEQNAAKLYTLEYMERIRQMKNDSEMYREKSRTDQMTGLLNKYTTQFLIEQTLSKLSPTEQSALILIDLDHFKQINDTLGHLMGDTIICQTASIIQKYFKENSLCGRIGGDEFLVFIKDASEQASLLLQVEILRQELSRQTAEHDLSIQTQASIGIAFSSSTCCDYETLFSAADEALYQAKLEGRNKIIVAD